MQNNNPSMGGVWVFLELRIKCYLAKYHYLDVNLLLERFVDVMEHAGTYTADE